MSEPRCERHIHIADHEQTKKWYTHRQFTSGQTHDQTSQQIQADAEFGKRLPFNLLALFAVGMNVLLPARAAIHGTKLGCANKLAAIAEQTGDDRACVIQRDANAQRHEEWQILQAVAPRAKKRPLAANVER